MTLAFYRHLCIKKIWELVVFLPPITILAFGLMIVSVWKYICCKSQQNRRNLEASDEAMNQGERNQGEHDLRNILISITRNRVRHNNNRNPAVMDASIINGIIRNWKTTYNPDLNTLQEVSCVICLEQFAQNEEVIALHCSKAHIFHQEWISGWAINHKTCPIWRKNFYEIYQTEVHIS